MDQDCEVCTESYWRPGSAAVTGTTDDPNRRLNAAIRAAHMVLAEDDPVPPPETTLLTIVRAALDARALLAGASSRWPSAICLHLLLEALILFCAQPDFELEAV